jgi:predicted dehydrogenase
MKMTRLVLIGLLGSLSLEAQAQRSGTGVGVILGEPTGISLKHWVTADHAMAAAAAWSLAGRDALQLHADYLIHNFDALRGDLPDPPALYYGVGARLQFLEGRSGRSDADDDPVTSVRFPVGCCYFLGRSALDLFVELVPSLDVAPSTEFNLDAAVGARFYFN